MDVETKPVCGQQDSKEAGRSFTGETQRAVTPRDKDGERHVISECKSLIVGMKMRDHSHPHQCISEG